MSREQVLAHLPPDVRPVAELDAEARIAHIRCDRWIQHSAAQRLLGYLQEALSNLAWLVHGLPPDVRRWLRVAAQDWGPLAGRRVCEVLDAKEADLAPTLAAGREPATKVVGRRTSRDTVCAGAAEKRLRVAAAKRIAARARRRKAARHRKSNQARDKL